MALKTDLIFKITLPILFSTISNLELKKHCEGYEKNTSWTCLRDFNTVYLCSWHKNTDVVEELAACIVRAALMMETAGFSEMMVYFYQTTWYHIPEDSNHQSHFHENLKSQEIYACNFALRHYW